ncbi:MAG: DEAD/DEAH box helicase [Thermoplasmata archaeon]
MVQGLFEDLSTEVRDVLEEIGIERPTPPQEVAIPEVLRGEDLLLIAPTGSGKTEAVLLPIFDLLQRDESRRGISLLYITPLRALNRDMLRRIDHWASALGFTVEVRHGDTPTKERRRQAVKPPDMLITTPETLQAILPGKVMKKHLEQVRWVVVDELHQIAGNRRGVQLAVGLERLRKLARDFQVLGLSATVGNPSELAAFLGGARSEARVLRVEAEKEVKYFVELPDPVEDDYELARLLYTSPEQAAVLNRIAEQVEEHEASLTFVNSRVNAESLVSKFNLFFKGIGVHHGSLPREERTRTEDDFKAGRLRALVCTSTLELGIDIGSVDFVMQYMSPRQVSSLVQRVGRSGHTLDRTSEGVILTLSTEEVLESVAAIKRAQEDLVEAVSVPKAPLDVLAHQVMGCLLDESGRSGLASLRRTLQGAYPYRDLSKEAFWSVVEFMGRMRLLRVEGEEAVITRKGRMYYFENLSTIPDEKLWPVVDLTTQKKVGLLGDEFMAKKARVGLNFVVRGQAWKMEKIAEDGYVYVNPVMDPRALLARWDGELLPIPFELAQDVGRLKGEVVANLVSGDLDEIVEGLRKRWPSERSAIRKVLKELRAQIDAGAAVPTDETILVEGFDRYLIIHSHLGEKLNFTLGEILQEVLSQDDLLRFWWSDGYRVLLELTAEMEDLDLQRLVASLFGLEEEHLTRHFETVLHERSAFGYYMKFIAERFGALRRGLFIRPDELREMSIRFRGSPIYDETVREVLEEHLDFEGLRDLYRRVREGSTHIATHQGERPTPLGYPIVRRYIESAELLSPGVDGGDNVERMRKYLEHELVNLLCMECGTLQEGRQTGELEKMPECPECGSRLLGLVQWWSDHIQACLMKKLAGEEIKEEDLKLLVKTRQSADMVLSYGRRAIVAQCVYGIGPQTAGRLLAKMHDREEDLYRDLMEAKMTFITNRPYWDRP